MKKMIGMAAGMTLLFVGLGGQAVAQSTPRLLLITSDGATGVSVGDPQVKDDLFDGTEKFAQGASDVSDVNLDKNMLDAVGMGKHDKSGMASRMDFVVVHSYTYPREGMYRMEDVDAFRKKLTDGSWNCFIHTRDKEGSTDICSRTVDHGETNELAIMTAEPKELTFVHLRGKLSLNDLSKMGGHMGAPTPPTPPVPPAPPAPLVPRN